MNTSDETNTGPDEQARIEELRLAFHRAFGAQPDFVVRAPGRINLIGEHTDYNGGFVLPAAINRTVLMAVRPVPDSRVVRLYSCNFDNLATFDLAAITPTEDEALSWSNYVRAVAWALGDEGIVDLAKMPGAQVALEGNVPLASGLSSSAAIEVASGRCFLRLAETRLDGKKLALVCQRAENNFIGVKSGIMDQFISALGQPDSALLIDTRSLEYTAVPLGLQRLGYKLVAVDSAVPRSLITSAYNERKSECEQAMKIIASRLDLDKSAQLRDVGLEQLEAHRDYLPEVLYRRAHHVVSEDVRTLEAAQLMGSGLDKDDNMARFGELLYASHASLRDDYQVSSPELDMLVELARNVPGVAGARMTGAGFGGCTVNIVQETALSEFDRQVVREYRQRTGLDAQLYVCEAVEGGSYLE